MRWRRFLFLLPVRLACVKHIASVPSEPESKSKKTTSNYINNPGEINRYVLPTNANKVERKDASSKLCDPRFYFTKPRACTRQCNCPTNFNFFFLVYLLLLTRTKELNKCDRAAHEKFFKTKTRQLHCLSASYGVSKLP